LQSFERKAAEVERIRPALERMKEVKREEDSLRVKQLATKSKVENLRLQFQKVFDSLETETEALELIEVELKRNAEEYADLESQVNGENVREAGAVGGEKIQEEVEEDDEEEEDEEDDDGRTPGASGGRQVRPLAAGTRRRLSPELNLSDTEESPYQRSGGKTVGFTGEYRNNL
jgi:hypothetical protein